MTYQEAIEHFGSAAKTALALKISKVSVSKWKSNDQIPLASQFKIYYLSDHKLDIDSEYKLFLGVVG